jgi:hypothetical protein
MVGAGAVVVVIRQYQ